jgi:RecA/RadA recombinase
MKKDKVIYFRTGSDVLDMVVGGAPEVYGYPAGKFINIVGDKSAGKTFLANEIIAFAYHQYGKDFKWVYDDCESGYSFSTENLYGFDIMYDDMIHSETVEQAFCNISDFAESLKKGQFGIYVIDSLDGLTSIEAKKQAKGRLDAHRKGKVYDEGSYNMGKPRYLSKEFFPSLCTVIQNKNILVIIISQVRENIDMFSFEKFKRNGGKALDFYAYVVLWLATMKKAVKKGRAVGVEVKAKVTKGKIARPYRECMFSLLFDYGLDNTGTNVDFLFDLRTDKGELKTSKKNEDGVSIVWGESKAEKPNALKIKAWVKKQDGIGKKSKNALDDFNKKFDKCNLDNLLEFIEGDDSLKEKYKEEFGESGGQETYSRESLIRMIEEKGLEDELRQKVIDKWESIESAIKTQRRKKYSTQPVSGIADFADNGEDETEEDED